jgi:hypothetical protein
LPVYSSGPPTRADVLHLAFVHERRARAACLLVTADCPANRPPKRLAKASTSSELTKQNTTTSLSSRRREYVSDVADRALAAENITSVFEAPHRFDRGRSVMRPFALKITAGDFAFTAGHRRMPSVSWPVP